MLLALDTATDQGSVAVFDGRTVRAELSWAARHRQGDDLFATVDGVLALAGLRVGAIARIAVAIGPGSFTGVRVAIAAALGIARGSGAVIVGVPTLDVLARPLLGRAVQAVLRAGRDDFYGARYSAEGSRAGDFSLGPLREIAGGALVVGDVTAEEERSLRERGLDLAPPSMCLRRAGVLAEIGWHASPVNGPLEPVYVRAPAIGGRA